MSHHCPTLIFRCMDSRIKPSVLADLIQKKIGRNEGDYDLVSVAGSAKDLLSQQSGEKDFLLKQIRLSQKLHQIQEVIVLCHDNCGAYGISDAHEEQQIQTTDLAKIKSLLNSEFPNLAFQAHIIKGVASDNLSLQKVI